jgi:broad specificity polyphosphatase/5'/3'-nucleotidase SurE
METYTNQNGEECVIVTNDDGAIWSGLKSAYDAMQAEQSTPIVIDEAKTK